MMTPKKRFRFGERTENAPDSSASGQIALTPEDKENLDAYVAKIEETVEILRKEIEAIKNGQLDVVSTGFSEKSRVLKWLELRTPLIEPFLQHDVANKLNIKAHLAELKKYIEEDGAMLSRMAVAARTILREVDKINNRNGLGGVYGKSGEKVAGVENSKMRIDREF